MKFKLRSPVFVFLSLLFLLSGWLLPVSAQQFLILEKPGKVKNFKYKIGDKINLRKKADPFLIHGEINRMNDSLLWVDYSYVVKIKEIDEIVKVRKLSLFMTELTLKGAIGVMAVSTINNIIAKKTIVEPGAVAITGALLSTGAIFYLIRHKSFKIGTKWRLKVIDFTPLQFDSKPSIK